MPARIEMTFVFLFAVNFRPFIFITLNDMNFMSQIDTVVPLFFSERGCHVSSLDKTDIFTAICHYRSP